MCAVPTKSSYYRFHIPRSYNLHSECTTLTRGKLGNLRGGIISWRLSITLAAVVGILLQRRPLLWFRIEAWETAHLCRSPTPGMVITTPRYRFLRSWPSPTYSRQRSPHLDAHATCPIDSAQPPKHMPLPHPHSHMLPLFLLLNAQFNLACYLRGTCYVVEAPCGRATFCSCYSYQKPSPDPATFRLFLVHSILTAQPKSPEP